MTARRLAFIYDTANVLSRISDGAIETKHVLSPLIIRHSAQLSVAILPVVQRDLTRVRDWQKLLGEITNFVRNGVKNFNLYLKESEFQDELSELKPILKTIKVQEGEVETIASLKPASVYTCYFYIDHKPKVVRNKDVRNLLMQLLKNKELKECREANPEDAIENLEMYVLPYLSLLSGYGIVLITDDACFRVLTKSYSQRVGPGVEALDVGALVEVGRLRKALRSIINASL